MLEFWNQGWVGIVSGALIGVAISYAFYLKSMRDPMLCEAVRASRVLGVSGTADYSEHVAVTFRGEEIPQLSVATVTVWNAGSATLDQSALVALDPLRVVVLGVAGRVLEAKLDANPNVACGCIATLDPKDPRAVRLTFDYLNPGDGFSVRLLHTASEPAVRVEGSLKGAKRRSEDGEVGGAGWLQRTARSLIPWAVAAAFLYFVNTPTFRQITEPPTWLPFLPLLAISVLIAVLIAIGNWSSRKPYLMPRALRQPDLDKVDA